MISKTWDLSEDDQVAAQSHADLAVRRTWSAWLAATNEVRRLENALKKIKSDCEYELNPSYSVMLGTDEIRHILSHVAD